jgi:nucleoid-associated protein YgaU
MSVALDFAPSFDDAPRRRPLALVPDRSPEHVPAPRPERLASVHVLLPPREAVRPAPVRLTRRGLVVLALAVAALGGLLVWLAALSAPGASPAVSAPTSVTVRSGDTLWSIASRVAPGHDPRAEVAALQQANHLSGVDLVPGQVLQVP